MKNIEIKKRLLAIFTAVAMFFTIVPLHNIAEAKTSIYSWQNLYVWYMPQENLSSPSGYFLVLCFGVIDGDYYQLKPVFSNTSEIPFDHDHFFYKCSEETKEVISGHANNNAYITSPFITKTDLDAIYAERFPSKSFHMTQKIDGGSSNTNPTSGAESLYTMGYGVRDGNLYAVYYKYKPQVERMCYEFNVSGAFDNTGKYTGPARLITNDTYTGYTFVLKNKVAGDSSRARAFLEKPNNTEACTKVLIGVPVGDQHRLPGYAKIPDQTTNYNVDALSNRCKSYEVKKGEVTQLTSDVFLRYQTSIVVRKGATLIIRGRVFCEGNIVVMGTLILEDTGEIITPCQSDNGWLKIVGGEVIIKDNAKICISHLCDYGGTIINYGGFFSKYYEIGNITYNPIEYEQYACREEPFNIEARKGSFTDLEISKFYGYPALTSQYFKLSETNMISSTTISTINKTNNRVYLYHFRTQHEKASGIAPRTLTVCADTSYAYYYSPINIVKEDLPY